jgi:hypothetical protein
MFCLALLSCNRYRLSFFGQTGAALTNVVIIFNI